MHAQDIKKGGKADAVSLGTIHRFKGLEWDVVVLRGCNTGLLPMRFRPASGLHPKPEAPLDAPFKPLDFTVSQATCSCVARAQCSCQPAAVCVPGRCVLDEVCRVCCVSTKCGVQGCVQPIVLGQPHAGSNGTSTSRRA